MIRWLVVGVLSLAVLLSVTRLVFFDVWEGDDWMPPRWDGKPRFSETRYSKMTVPPNVLFWRRLAVEYAEFQRRFGKRNAARYSFPATTNTLHGVHGLLTQGMEVTGTKYLIAQEVATVELRHTNVLNGAQWVAAVEAALQTNQPQCHHPASNRFWGENLLLIREKPGVVKVIPPSRLTDYQKAGLVSASYVPEQSSPATPAK